MKTLSRTLLLAGLFLAACSGKDKEPENPAPDTAVQAGMELGGADVLAFGPDDVLFVGDSRNGRIYAIPTNAQPSERSIPFNWEGVDGALANALGIERRDVIVHDMKVHPKSQEAYLAVRKGPDPNAAAVIAVIGAGQGQVRLLEGDPNTLASVTLDNPASDELMFWNETPASQLSITDMDFHDGHLFVAGLTNAEFASNIRKIAYPFDGTQEAVSGVEIYHAVHTQNETRAPIRTMLFNELDGQSTLIASYTCTPLVTIPVSEIRADNHVTGKTIAELGYGNTPIDMLVVSSQGFDGSVTQNLLVTHKNQSGTVIPLAALSEGAKGPGLAGTQAMFATGLEGMVQIPTANIMQIDVQNASMLAMVRRNPVNGDIDLVSELTGTYLRLSDFISEYDFPDYRYPEAQAMTKQYHDQVKQMEGYPDLTSENLDR